MVATMETPQDRNLVHSVMRNILPKIARQKYNASLYSRNGPAGMKQRWLCAKLMYQKFPNRFTEYQRTQYSESEQRPQSRTCKA